MRQVDKRWKTMPRKIREPIVTVSTTIPLTVYQGIKENGFKMNFLIQRGYLLATGEPQLADRVRELEAANDKLIRKLNELAQQNFEYEQKGLQSSE